MPGNLQRGLTEAYAHLLHRKGGVRLLLGIVDGTPAVAGSLLIREGVAGIYSLTVRPDFRGRGLGRWMMQGLHSQAFREGCRSVVLQATKAGLPLYEKLGYRSVGRMGVYRWEAVGS